MIAVDTSALMAIALDEPEAQACAAVLGDEDSLIISAGTLAELMIVAAKRGVHAEIARLVEDLGFEIAPVTGASARRMAEAYARWGKGQSPAGLNFGDCFAYEVAMTQHCPLLFVGDDFRKTDVEAAI